MASLIMEALAFDSGRADGVNVEAGSNSGDGYIESAIVSLASAKRENPHSDTVLFCNEPVSVKHLRVASEYGVVIKIIPFDEYIFPSEISWHLAYFKLCALKHALLLGYDAICLMDADTWCRGSLSELLECPRGIFMVELESRFSNKDRISMEATWQELGLEWSRRKICSCWGGEFICGNTSSLWELLDGADTVYHRMLDLGVTSSRGDEFLLYASANRSAFPAFSANAYVRRVWTGRYFTPCRHEAYSVLHLPAEKNYAFPKAWRELERGSLVSSERFVNWCGIRVSRRPMDFVWAVTRIVQKLGLGF